MAASPSLPSELFPHGADTVGADVLPAEIDDALRAVAEDTCGLVFAQNDGVSLHIDFERVPFRNVQRPPQFYGKHNSPQLIHFPDNSC